MVLAVHWIEQYMCYKYVYIFQVSKFDKPPDALWFDITNSLNVRCVNITERKHSVTVRITLKQTVDILSRLHFASFSWSAICVRMCVNNCSFTISNLTDVRNRNGFLISWGGWSYLTYGKNPLIFRKRR